MDPYTLTVRILVNFLDADNKTLGQVFAPTLTITVGDQCDPWDVLNTLIRRMSMGLAQGQQTPISDGMYHGWTRITITDRIRGDVHQLVDTFINNFIAWHQPVILNVSSYTVQQILVLPQI